MCRWRTGTAHVWLQRWDRPLVDVACLAAATAVLAAASRAALTAAWAAAAWARAAVLANALVASFLALSDALAAAVSAFFFWLVPHHEWPGWRLLQRPSGHEQVMTLA